MRATVISILCLFLFLACQKKNEQVVESAPLIKNVSVEKKSEKNKINIVDVSKFKKKIEAPKNVSAISACSKLNLRDLNTIFPEKIFKIETSRNDPPTATEAISFCRYQEEVKDPASAFAVDLEIVTKTDSAVVKKMLNERRETLYSKKGKALNGYGAAAYYYESSDGAKLEFVLGNVLYKINIQALKLNGLAKLENDLGLLAKKIIEKNKKS